ncbi:MAG: hypothetical protein KME08_14260 [Aphanothece sp. CMT-3BRIN-NPC111]|nr:hypothetical protein [Aphanothece sp. CMT-3BRIN-NPC111]
MLVAKLGYSGDENVISIHHYPTAATDKTLAIARFLVIAKQSSGCAKIHLAVHPPDRSGQTSFSSGNTLTTESSAVRGRNRPCWYAMAVNPRKVVW